MQIKIKRLTEQARIPTIGSNAAAGYDLYADLSQDNDTWMHNGVSEVQIAAGETRRIKTGIAMAIPEGFVGLLFPRSGIAAKRGLRLANCVGVIDADYRGEFMAAIYNDSNQTQTITHGERVAQLVIVPHIVCEFEEVNELDETGRGCGGFGSTGKT